MTAIPRPISTGAVYVGQEGTMWEATDGRMYEAVHEAGQIFVVSVLAPLPGDHVEPVRVTFEELDEILGLPPEGWPWT
jgi:hypothetical protein